MLLESVRNPRADQVMRDSPACREALTRYEEDVLAYAAAFVTYRIALALGAG